MTPPLLCQMHLKCAAAPPESYPVQKYPVNLHTADSHPWLDYHTVYNGYAFSRFILKGYAVYGKCR